MISAYKSCAAFIKACERPGRTRSYERLLRRRQGASARDGSRGAGVGISQVVPFPWNLSARVVKDYQQALAASTGKQNYSFTSLEGYIAAKVLVEGLRRAGNDPTRERFVAAMEQIRDFDVGGYIVTFSPVDHNGSKFVELTVIGKDEGFLR